MSVLRGQCQASCGTLRPDLLHDPIQMLWRYSHPAHKQHVEDGIRKVRAQRRLHGRVSNQIDGASNLQVREPLRAEPRGLLLIDQHRCPVFQA